MDGARLSRFPDLSWLRASFALRADASLCVHDRTVTHCLSMVLDGRHAVRYIHRGHESRWTELAGTLHFRPCEGEHDHFLIHTAAPGDVVALYIPEHHLCDVAAGEGVTRKPEWRRHLLADDAILRQAMLALLSSHGLPDGSPARADEAARRIVLRLSELSGGGMPDWHDDASAFDRRTMHAIVDYLDAHLRVAPSLGDMGWRVGLSPSHFARKFRRSTGLSLCRFVNRRRILRSLDMLKTDTSPAGVALDLGFSSQSHFTRIFSGLTGMTPAAYRRLVRRTVG